MDDLKVFGRSASENIHLYPEADGVVDGAPGLIPGETKQSTLGRLWNTC